MTTDKTFVIAEAGSCHDGDFQKAVRLVNLAHQIGADAVKFQWVSNPERLADRRHAGEYLWSYRLISFPTQWHVDLMMQARAYGLEYMCTVYLPEDIPVIAPYVQRFKISSFEAGDVEFAAAHRDYRKPTIVSHGMGGPRQLTEQDADKIYKSMFGVRIDYLHCVSGYPTPHDQINLRAIRDGYYDGLSDHTYHAWTGGLAVAAGARIIEFHYRLGDSSPSGADYATARDPGQAIEYVKNIRMAEVMMGSGEPGVQNCERGMLRYRVKA